MADPDLICLVEAGGGKYRDWLSVAVTYTYQDTVPLRHFDLVCAEPSKVGQLQLRPGDRANVYLAGRKVIDDGFIKIRQVGYDGNRHAVQIKGLSKAGAIQQASCEMGQLRGYTLEQIGKSIAKKYGVQFRLVNPPAGADKKFPNVIAHMGETDWEYLSRLAGQRGVMLRAEPNGDLVGGIPDGGSGATLEESVNILSLNCYIEFPWADTVVGRSQTLGNDEVYGRRAAAISATAKLSEGATGLKAIIPATRPLNSEENETATDAYARQILQAILQVTVTHHGWFKPGTQDLWQLGDTVTVKSPMAFANANGKLDLRVFTVVCSQSSETGTTTTVQLVSEAAFQRRFPDANAGDPYNPGSTQAMPEASA